MRQLLIGAGIGGAAIIAAELALLFWLYLVGRYGEGEMKV